MRECPTCHEQTPGGNFCVRCGAPLDAGLSRARHRHQFAAAPAQGRYVPWLVSTLFPHLPKHSERHFRLAVALGASVVIVLAAVRVFGVALICAALLMPLLTILYFHDVDVYEQEPGWAIGWTFGWGVIAGVAVGLLAGALAPTGSELIDRGSDPNVFLGGILIPAIGVAAMLVGPIVLLRYRRFNETLDGATFGAATAATFAAAQAIVVGAEVVGGGLRPAGAAAPWIARMAGLAVAMPVLAMSVVGAAAAALWLRYRAPVENRRALGVLGIPLVAVSLAAVMLIAGALGETFMAAGTWLAWMALLDVAGLVLLRRSMHVGLLEEADEKDVGPPVQCANCGAMTPRHTFCSNCGIALKALPKAGAARRRVISTVVALAVIAALAVATVAVAAPSARRARCRPHAPCGAPPKLGEPRQAFAGYRAWQSPVLGYSLRYRANDWHRSAESASDLSLTGSDGISTIDFHAVAGQGPPSELLQRQVASLQGKLLGLVHDDAPGDRLLGAAIGLRGGVGDVYNATTTTPQGPSTPLSISIMASNYAGVSVSVTVTVPANDSEQRTAQYAKADDVVNSVQWRIS